MDELAEEAIHIEIRPGDLPIAAQMVMGRTTRPLLVAILSGPEGTEEYHEVAFIKQFSTPLEFLQGTDQREGLRALDDMNAFLQSQGFRLAAQGPFWFSRRYTRKYIPHRLLGTQRDPRLVAALDRYVALNPHDNHALERKAHRCAFDGHFPEAFRYAMAALALEPNNIDAHFALAWALLGLNRPAEALPHAQRVATFEQRYFGMPASGLQILQETQMKLGLPLSQPLSVGKPSTLDSAPFMGIAGIAASFCCPPLGLVLAIASLIEAKRRGQSITTGYVALVLASALTIFLVVYALWSINRGQTPTVYPTATY